jgi:hypothetical protein
LAWTCSCRLELVQRQWDLQLRLHASGAKSVPHQKDA